MGVDEQAARPGRFAEGVQPDGSRSADQKDRRADALVALLLLCLASPASAKEPPADDRQEERLTGKGPFQTIPPIDESVAVILSVSKAPYWSFGTVDPVLSEACRQGDFATIPMNRIQARFSGPEGEAYFQVVPPLYRHLLVDRRKLAQPGVTYYFFSTAQPDCEVRVPPGVRVRQFPAGRGTALPPANPLAVAQRKALIATWPKK